MRLRGARAPASVMSAARSAAGARDSSPPPSTNTTSASFASSLEVVSLSVVVVLVSRQLTSATTGENVTPFDPVDIERAGGGAPSGGGPTNCNEALSSSGVSRCGVARARNSGVDLTRASPDLNGVELKTGSRIGSGEGVRGGDGVADCGSRRRRNSSSTSSHAPHESCNRVVVRTERPRSKSPVSARARRAVSSSRLAVVSISRAKARSDSVVESLPALGSRIGDAVHCRVTTSTGGGGGGGKRGARGGGGGGGGGGRRGRRGPPR